MKIIGIIVEYNPFHNGHLHQINTLRKQFNPDGIIVVMSGNFVQRGEPAIFDKWIRAEMALACGVDLVLELPTFYATASAEAFAHGAVETLISTGIVTHLAFGVERPDLRALNTIAELLVEEPDAYKSALQEALQAGVSFPVARMQALKACLLDTSPELLDMPNAILAVEYLKALKRQNTSIIPIALERVGSGYNDLETNTTLASATAIRRAYAAHGDLNSLAHMLPPPVSTIIANSLAQGVKATNWSHFEGALLYRLRLEESSTLKMGRAISEGLENKLKSASRQVDFEAITSTLKSKRYTSTRINRILINTLLDIKTLDFINGHSPSASNAPSSFPIIEPSYLRVLGFNRTGQGCLKAMKSSTNRHIITTLSKAPKVVFNCPHLKLDLKATDIYDLAQPREGGRDFLTSPIRV